MGALGLALLAGCQSNNSCSMGSSSGYQIDGASELMSCTTMPPATSGAGTMATNPADPVAVAQNTGFNIQYGATFYGMTRAAGTLPIAGASTTLALTGSAHPLVNPSANDYTLTLTTFAAGYVPTCEIAGGGKISANPSYPMIGATETLRVNYPPFTGSGTFTINCVGVNGTLGNTTVASFGVIVP